MIASQDELERLGLGLIEQVGGILDGTVGWQDDQPHFDVENGHTLVKVTLFEGRNAELDGPLPKDGRAHGHQVRCRTNGPMHWIPPDGAQVQVAYAAKRLRTPGGGVIIGNPGESRNYADEHTFMRIDTARGRVTLYTTHDGTKDGRPIYLQVNRDKGIVAITPWGTFEVGPNGISGKHSSGARFRFGSVGGLPAPFDSLSSMAQIEAAIVKLKTSALSIGVGAGAEPLAKATSVLAVLAALDTFLVGLQTDRGAIGADLAAVFTALGLGVPTSTATLASAFAPAVIALGTAIGVGNAAIPSKSGMAT